MSVTVLVDRAALMRTAAERVIRAASAAIGARGRFNWALSGGSTPAALYRLLASPGCTERVDWSRVHFFWSDERCVPPEHAESNFRMAREALLDAVAPPSSPMDQPRIHRLEGELPPPAAAQRYEAELARHFGVESEAGLPAFDLILLGMGPDGHTASLFPGSLALSETQRWVVANEVPSLGTTRLTFTLPLINAAKGVLFLVAGADKAERLEQVVAQRARPPLPAQLVRARDTDPDWVVDADAGARLGLPIEAAP